MDTPPCSPRSQLRTTRTANLRSEPSTQASKKALLNGDVILWQDGQQGDWYEVWVRGYVHKDMVKSIG